MAGNALPLDDLELEMEEMEGLIEVSAVGSGKRKKLKPSRTESGAVVVAGWCSRRYRCKWACLVLMLAGIVAFLFVIDTNDLMEAVGMRGSHVSKGKKHKKSKPTTEEKDYWVTPAEPLLDKNGAKERTDPGKEDQVEDIKKGGEQDKDPSKSTEAPVKATEAPAKDEKATETPVKEPVKVTEAPKATEPPVKDAKATETPVNEPSKATEAPKATEPPIKDDKAGGKAAEDAAAEKSDSPKTKGDAWLPKPFTVKMENPPSQAVLDDYAKTWGTWELDELPQMEREAFCGSTSHCDVPRKDFATSAWQNDAKYLQKFLDEADKLVDRAMHAILAEYGKSPEETEMFDLEYKEFERRQLGKGPPSNGGWTTKRSMQGLARRLLHAIMTRDTFTFVMGGHSAAAGHGNHFKQSYTMQFHRVMEPVLAYLGVQLISRNMAQGGLGTIQSALGSADIYGDEIDFLVWDSGMTEGRDGKAMDMFGRQALLAHRVPVLWNLSPNLLELYHKECGADVGLYGTGEVGIPVTKNETHAETLPYALRFMKCDTEQAGLCKYFKFHSNCWVERPDVTPPTAQQEHPGSQVSWHPGNRWHQLTGRILAYTVLTGLKEAIGTWKSADNYALKDEDWHVTPYYDNIRNKVTNLVGKGLGNCEEYEGAIPLRMCNTQMRGRTEFAPRANPDKTSIQSILKGAENIPSITDPVDVLYHGPDVRNPFYDIPEGQIDVLAILNNKRKYPESTRRLEQRRAAEDIVPGKGLDLLNSPPGYCDGSYNAICGRDPSSNCLLYGHHDARAGIQFHEYSGWLVMEVPKVKHGIIVIKLECWHFQDESERTGTWKTVNNERNLAIVQSADERRLKREQIPFSDDFLFDYAVDGKMHTLNVTEFQKLQETGHIQRVVTVFTMLDDPNYVKEGEEKNVEVAIRVRNGHGKAFKLTHVYFA